MPKTLSRLLCGLAVVLFIGTAIWAQGMFATLTGVVSDSSGALVSNAKATLRDAASGSERADSHGYYTFASVPVGSYILTIEASGFQTYKVQDIRLGGSEKRNINATLEVGATSQTVEVTGAADIVAPVDSGEKSSTLTTKELQNFVQVGSNAAEYIKIMPGFGIQNGAVNKSNYSGQTIGINGNGDSGSQSPLNNAFNYNGLPTNTLDIVADGAHVSDPGCNCDTPVNPNSDFLQEFKILTSNYGAENRRYHVGDESRRIGVPRQRVLRCQELRLELERRLRERDRHTAACEQVLLSRRQHRWSRVDPLYQLQ